MGGGECRGRGEGGGGCLLTLARVLKERWGRGGGRGPFLLTLTRVSYVS